MQQFDHLNNQPVKNQPMNPSGSIEESKPQNTLSSPVNTIAVYTVLSILIKMKGSLGLEAMLEYMGRYLGTIEKHNPRLKYAVSRAIQLINIEKIYQESVYGEKT